MTYRILVTHGVESWLSEVTEGVIITLKLSYMYIFSIGCPCQQQA